MTYKTALAARPAGGTTGIGLGAAWALDETSGTIASELLGVTARNGTYTGTITLNQQALVPNSSAKHPTFGGGYVSIPNDSLFSPAGSTGKILVTAIVRPASLANGQVIASKLGAGAQEWNLYANADGSVTVQILQSGGTIVKQCSTPAGAVAVGRTSSVAFYWTASGPAGTSFGDLGLFIDGSLQAEANQLTANVGSVTAGTAALVIGGRADGGGTPWAGQIGFVALYGSSDYGFYEPITLQRLFGVEGSGDVFDFGQRPDSATALGKAETGESWTVPSGGGTWGLTGFRQYAAALGTTWPNPGAQAVVPFSQADMDVSAAIIRPNNTSKGVGIIARQSDASNFWFALIFNTGGSNSSLYCGKVVAGTNTYSVVNALGLGTSQGPFRVRLRCKGDRIQVFVDGVLQGEVSDSFNNSATNAGLLSYDANPNSWARNFRVSKPPAPITGGDVINEQRFTYTGAVQQFTVPIGVRRITVDTYGAAGGDAARLGGGGLVGGYGARVQCGLIVTPGEVLEVYVGGMGGGGSATMPTPNQGGWNGGGAQFGDSWAPSVGGGGASDVRRPNGSSGTTIYVASWTGLPNTGGQGFLDQTGGLGGWTVSGGILTGVTSASNFWSAAFPLDAGDRTVELELKVSSTDPSAQFGQWVQIGNNARFLDVSFFKNKITVNDNSVGWNTFSGVVDSGTVGVDTNYPGRVFDLSTAYHRVRLVIQGTTFYLYLDGELLYSRTIVRAASGNSQVAFGQGAGGTTGNWSIRKLWAATSAIHTNNERLVVAGGGGGAAHSYGMHGGLVAGLTAGDNGLLSPNVQGGSHGGGGATQTSPGAGGTNNKGDNSDGIAGIGPTGGVGSGYSSASFGGGGGGGGYYGGGGGGRGSNWGGAAGGGGSGLSSGINELALVGAHYGNGEVRIQWETPAPTLLVGGGTALAATGNNRMSKSTDVGATWGLVTTPDDAMTNARGFRGIAWSPSLSLWVACATHNAGTATTGAHIVTSPDGTTWTSRSSPVDASAWSPEAVVWAPELSLFVLVGQTAGAALVLTSPDGVTWTQRTIANIGRLADIAWSGSLFMTVADNGNGSNIATSSDGITWSNRTLPVPAGGGTFTSFGYAAVIWEADQGVFVVGGNFSYNPGFGGSTYNVVKTTDGSTTTLCNGSFTGSGARCVAIGNYPPLGLTIMLGWTGSAWQIWTGGSGGQTSNTQRTVPFNGTALNGTAFGFVGSDGLGDDATLYAGVYDNNGSVAFAKSSDGGQTWSSVTITGLASGTGFGVAPSVQPPGFFTIAVAGVVSSSGFLGLGNFIVTAGAITSGGTLARKWSKVLAGQITPTGIVAPGRFYFRAFSGSVGSTGSLIRQAGKKVAGAVSSHGVVGTRVSHPFLAAMRDLGSNIRLAPSLIRPVIHALGLDGQLATDAAWHSLSANLANDGATGRLRKFPDGSTWLYVGLTPHGTVHNFNLFDVTDPSRLKALGVADLANVAGGPELPAFWSDEWPRYVAVSTGRGAGVGSVTSAGMQIVDVGDEANPLLTPIMGARHEVTFGSISGGDLDFIVQKGERSYWGATYGFVQVSRLEYEVINALSFDAAGEITWTGSSEFASPRRFVTFGGVVHHPTEDYLYCFGPDYTILWSTDPALGLAPATLAPSIGQVDPNGNGYNYLQPMPDGPTLWGVRAIPSSGNIGVEIVYIDVSNPLAPVQSYVWRVSNDGTLMGGDVGFIQAVYDKRNLRLTVRRGSGPTFNYFLYDLDIVARKVNSVLQIPNPNSPGADIAPQGTFTNRDYYGWWTSGAVYLFRALPAPNLTTAVRDARLTTGRPGIAVR